MKSAMVSISLLDRENNERERYVGLNIDVSVVPAGVDVVFGESKLGSNKAVEMDEISMLEHILNEADKTGDNINVEIQPLSKSAPYGKKSKLLDIKNLRSSSKFKSTINRLLGEFYNGPA